jgi:hypothetical protein
MAAKSVWIGHQIWVPAGSFGFGIFQGAATPPQKISATPVVGGWVGVRGRKPGPGPDFFSIFSLMAFLNSSHRETPKYVKKGGEIGFEFLVDFL